jgi:hypothetical protein
MKSPAAPTSQKERLRRLGAAFLPSTHPEFNQPLGIAELPIPILLAGFLALTVRILLLLSRLLAAALLLARLLSGILVLLAGILVLVGHRDLPFSKSQEGNRGTRLWLRGNPWFPACFFRFGRTVVPGARSTAGGKTISVQALEAPSGAVAASGSRC